MRKIIWFIVSWALNFFCFCFGAWCLQGGMSSLGYHLAFWPLFRIGLGITIFSAIGSQSSSKE